MKPSSKKHQSRQSKPEKKAASTSVRTKGDGFAPDNRSGSDDSSRSGLEINERAGQYEVQRFPIAGFGNVKGWQGSFQGDAKIGQLSSKEAIKFIHVFGQPALKTHLDEIAAVRNGIDYADFKVVYNLFDFSNKKWAEILGIGERSIQLLLKEKKAIDSKKSEKLIAFILFVRKGIYVFEDFSRFNDWLFYKSPVLKGSAPIDYVDTIQGIEMLEEQLFAIETGNLA